MKVMYFTATWCAPCKALKPIAQQVSAETGVPIDFIDVDQSRAQATSMQVSSVPTLIGVDSLGTIKFRHTGMTSKQQLKNLFTNS
jgi:thioredoxin 1